MTNATLITHNGRRAEVVQAAIRAFARKGYGGTTLADIAAEAGVSQPRISQIFGNKEAAYIDAHRAAAAEMLDVLARCAEPPFEVRKFGPGYQPLLRERPEILIMVFRTLTSAYVPAIGEEACRTISEFVRIVTEEAGGSHADAIELLERGLLVNAMLALGACELADEYPQLARVLEEVDLR